MRSRALDVAEGRLFGDDVDEFAGDDDDLGDGEAGGVFLDFGGFAGGRNAPSISESSVFPD